MGWSGLQYGRRGKGKVWLHAVCILKVNLIWVGVVYEEKQVSKMIPKFLAFKNHSEQEETLVKWLNIGSIHKYH